MLRFTVTRLRTAASAGASCNGFAFQSQKRSRVFPKPLRFYGTNAIDVDPVSLQMIKYALGHARSQKSDESYAQGLLVLEQCLSGNLREGTDTSRGMVLLAMSSLLSERGNIDEAIEKLETIQDFSRSSLAVRVAAMEGLVGLNLELGKDDTSSVLADKCLRLFRSSESETEYCTDGGVLEARAKAGKGLVELVLGNTESAGLCFVGSGANESCFGNVALSYGEYLHAIGNFSRAELFYQKAIRGVSETRDFVDPCILSTCNMLPEEVLLGASCALGQLRAHARFFGDAEDVLTRALTQAEECYGLHHPKVGIILTCIALMFRHKAKLEFSSTLLIQEGLYRRAIELLKSPPLESEECKVDRRDIIALARGGYADVLCVQQNRKAEGERMRKWAETEWGNHRLSLAEALEFELPDPTLIQRCQ
ncbi:uncharacterized protein LOC122644898 [Telopea speciosissima]|uniref:uncharacterized protein LOC122644898 n=1 Tax=Telopea speciosissima TaxID=54955 RepID=UPI001CC4A8C0|nr:uncharacterized protein LOC122644898 [Telopea speciosissima]